MNYDRAEQINRDLRDEWLFSRGKYQYIDCASLFDEVFKKYHIGEWDKFASFIMKRYSRRTVWFWGRLQIEIIDAYLHLPKRFVSEFEYEVLLAAHKGNPSKKTAAALKRLVVVKK